MSRKAPCPAPEPVAANPSDKLAYTITEAISAIGVGRSTLFDMIRNGEVQARKLRGRTVIARTELLRVLAEAPISGR